MDADNSLHWHLMNLASRVRKTQSREAVPLVVSSIANNRTQYDRQHRRRASGPVPTGGRRRTEREKEPAESSGLCSAHFAWGHSQTCQKRNPSVNQTEVSRSLPSNNHNRKLYGCKVNERGDRGVERKSPGSLPTEPPKRLSSQQPPPRVLRVVSPNTRRGLEGDYILEQERPNGQPLWRHTGGAYWFFSTPKGRWSIAGEDVAAEGFSRSSGWICQEMYHGGLTPDNSPSGWMLWDGSGFVVDVSVEVMAPEQNINRRACWPPSADGQNASDNYNPLFSNSNRCFSSWRNNF
eukprot:CAMPEP_0172817248 /NCGR_PEP_ID=MMETSP1075-20121228/13063_1 /TAXON_ID=2916 /ORGANISM="Ceratium fusus, Strain PA161109" /LENGTH=292 /DNA_ID=CAMNT_0013657399 /DNA_START=29 /DNA_END=907 /DNA_ORIENTATION=+